MNIHKKIDLIFNGDYYLSTNQSKTCKDAVRQLIDTLENRQHSLGGLSRTEAYILKHKDLLKARFFRRGML